MADAASPIHVIIDDETETVRVDPETGTIETDQPDGGVVVQLDAHRQAKGGEENPWFANLVDRLDKAKLATVANDLFEAITADDNSRAEYLQIKARGLALLGTKLEEPKASAADGSSVDGMSSVTNPLLLEAVLKGWANAQAELLPANGPVKIRDDGDETLAQDDLAESLERDFNHWFTTTAAEYYPDTSHMLLWGVYLGGSGIKKVYRCPMRRRPVSESVDTKDFIVSDTTKDLRACSRITHQIPMRPSVMKRMVLIGAYRDVTLTEPAPVTNAVDAKIAGIQGTTTSNQTTRPEDRPYTIWETQCELDLDEFIPTGSKFKGEGIPLPYLVTMDKDSREILAIRRDWDEDDKECERKRLYIRYPYVPGPGFYGTGMVNILGNASAAMTAAWREALDAGMWANFPGGLMAKQGNRQNSSVMRPGLGEFIPVDTGGLPISQVVMGMPYKDVSAGLMSLMDKITGQAKSVSGSPDIPVAEGIQNVPVGTMLASIEQATKIMAAAHKGMHTAQADEFQLIFNLFREHPEDFWRGNKVCPNGYWNEEKFLAALDQCQNRLVPVSDPNVPSHIHRVAKALALVNLVDMPQFAPFLNTKEVLERCLRAIREDPKGLVIQPPPPEAAQPGPLELAKMLEANAKVTQAATAAKKVEADAAAEARSAEVKVREAESRERVASVDLQRQVLANAHDTKADMARLALEQRAQQHTESQDLADLRLRIEEFQHQVKVDGAELALERLSLAIQDYEAKHPPKPASSKSK